MPEYPKKYMSITELTEYGFSRAMLNQYAHAQGCPCVRTSNKPKSKIKFDMSKFDNWLENTFSIL